MATADTAFAQLHALPVQPCSTPGTPTAQSSADPPSATLIGSVQRAMRLLECVAEHRYGAPAKQLARETGLALPTAYHLLRTLVHEGYLRRDKGLFFLGEAAERLSSSGAEQKRRSTVVDTMARWRDAIGVPVYYAMYRDGEIEVMCVSDTPGNPAVEGEPAVDVGHRVLQVLGGGGLVGDHHLLALVQLP
ncbi:hypothetical protein SVIOM342S_08603 [Streptomyces violaceorubidus]